MNEHIEDKSNLKYTENKELNEIMFQQNKMASMGEMIDNIAHQWRQPLMEMSSLFMPIEAKIKLNNNVDSEEVLKAIENLNHITKYMSKTIDDFRNFFMPKKEKQTFLVSTAVESVMTIIGKALVHSEIEIDINIKNIT